jgi:hypothetical protein
MATLFCTPDQYPAVRALVQIGLGPADIPDAVLDMPTFSGAADQFVLLALGQQEYPTPPDWKTDPNYTSFQIAADYWCAGLVAVNYVALTSERFDDYGYTREAPNWQQRAQWLRYQAEAMILLALGGTTALLNIQPVAFVNAPGNYDRYYLPW